MVAQFSAGPKTLNANPEFVPLHTRALEIGEVLKVQDHRICRKVFSIPNHPLRANFPETKITRYNLRNKSPAMPAIHTDRFKNTFFNRIVFKYNVAL